MEYYNTYIEVKKENFVKDNFGIVRRAVGEEDVLAIIPADVQPATRDYIYRTYGRDVEGSFEVFTDYHDILKEGTIITYAGKDYKITSLIAFEADTGIFTPYCQFAIKRIN